jgi:hypothetical protein
MKYRVFAALAAAAAVAAACAHPVDTAGAPSFGQSDQTLRTQQVMPMSQVDTTPPEGSGSQGALAQGRYRTGTTKPLLPSSSSIANPSSD